MLGKEEKKMPTVKNKITGEVVSKEPYDEQGMQDATDMAKNNPNLEVSYDYPASDAGDRMQNTPFTDNLGGEGQTPDFNPPIGTGVEGIDYDKVAGGVGGFPDDDDNETQSAHPNIGGWHPTSYWEFKKGGKVGKMTKEETLKKLKEVSESLKLSDKKDEKKDVKVKAKPKYKKVKKGYKQSPPKKYKKATGAKIGKYPKYSLEPGSRGKQKEKFQGRYIERKDWPSIVGPFHSSEDADRAEKEDYKQRVKKYGKRYYSEAQLTSGVKNGEPYKKGGKVPEYKKGRKVKKK
jgi:hypothetical protein